MSTHFAEVELKLVLLLVELAAGVYDGRLITGVAVDEVQHVRQRFHAVHLQLVDNCRLADILFRYNQPLELLLTCLDGYGQCTAYGLQPTVQTQFAHHHIVVEHVAFHLAVSCQDAHGQWQVVAGALLLDVGRRQVCRDIHGRHLKAVVDECCLDTVVTLLDSRVGQSCQVELHAPRHADFTRYRCYFQPVDSCTKGLYQHIRLSYFRTKVRISE